MATSRPNYIITAPPYSPDSGGGLFQHQLVHLLNTMGETAFVYQQPRMPRTARQHLSDLRRDPVGYWKTPPMTINSDLNTPVARTSDLRRDSIVVYPEIVHGNPLRARNVVRWLLYKPGVFHAYKFGRDEMFFRVGEMSDLPELTGGASDLYLWQVNPAYRNENRPDRKGACFIVRKGRDKPRIPQTDEAIQVDNLSHAEIADIFNRCEVFYSYDEATLYSQYAAVCGCLSVVVPGLYASRADWVAQNYMAQYGVAYGLGDLDHARATGSKVLGLLQSKEAAGRETVKRFVTLTQERFGR